jgi:iron(II)-dependent oxidoreductase
MATIAPRDPIAHHRRSPEPEEALAALNGVRERTLALVAHLRDEQLSSVLSPIMSPLVWDLAHIAAYEDLWLVHRHGGLDLLRPDLAELYDAFETPRSVRGEVELLDPPRARAYLSDVRERSALALSRHGVGDGTLYELVLRHELQHSETMRQTMALAGILPSGEPKLAALAGEHAWTEVPGGPFEMGAGAYGFAYDNERPCHTVELPAFQIALHPVRTADWDLFGEEGGYERRALWSPEGWAWMREREGVRDGRASTVDPATPMCHVSWFEAEAYANSVGARLPTEAEWEKAAALGLLAGVGEVWEWTASHFDGYPGFVAHPYREYSEVFFGEDYRVLRGGSWASDPRVATLTFRNWDLPIRDQIFAGLRLARDVS